MERSANHLSVFLSLQKIMDGFFRVSLAREPVSVGPPLSVQVPHVHSTCMLRMPAFMRRHGGAEQSSTAGK